jgi:hypothetical protein
VCQLCQEPALFFGSMEKVSWRSMAPPPPPPARAPLSSSQSSSSAQKSFKKSSGSRSSGASSAVPSTSPHAPVVIGQTYHGKVWNVLTHNRRLGMYCKFGEQKNQRYDHDGFVPKIIKNASGEEYQHGDAIQVICLTSQPYTLALSPAYVRPLLIVDVNGPLGNRAPYEPNSYRKFITRKYAKEFLEFCSQYYEIAIWSCAKRNNIELELFVNINVYFIWSQEESTSLYPRTSFISPKKVLFVIWPLSHLSPSSSLPPLFPPTLPPSLPAPCLPFSPLSLFLSLASLLERIVKGLRAVPKLQLNQHRPPRESYRKV